MKEELDKNSIGPKKERKSIPNKIPASNTVWDLLDSLTGTIEGPADWSEQSDHYLYGTPKQ
jgi:hypothetical protein